MPQNSRNMLDTLDNSFQSILKWPFQEHKQFHLFYNILIGRSLYMVENNFPTDFSNFMAAFITNMMLS
ncbi:hypothetical protein T08_6420 [Trichinella sp. T8]|nr:hypothetical protein T08_6420 [Trichinella sp. T8]